MLEDCQTREERWVGVSKLIERWLEERQELIVLYCSLSGVHAFAPNSNQSSQKLRKFCQILVDYASAGHFEVYEQLAQEGKDFEDDSQKILEEIYPHISLSTEVALDFNDRYGDAPEEETLARLKADLSTLGELLVGRFDLEDKLIEDIHNAHAELV